MTSRPRVLIVDDDPINIDLLEQELEPLGFEIITAMNGKEAIEQADRHRPDMILLDVMMPVLDGYAACRQIKQAAATRLIPVIMVTALGAVEERVKGLDAGADDFLTKPVDPRELRARIRSSLQLRRALSDVIRSATEREEQLSKFVPNAVRRTVGTQAPFTDLERRVIDVSVLFLDIAGYAALTERHGMQAITSLTERYFSAFHDRIHDAGGDITQTAGDGLMAVFQDDKPARHAITAVETAIALFDIAARLNADATVTALNFHGGLASGPALVGLTRLGGRADERWIYTADGQTTILAARLADAAKAGEIALSAATQDRLDQRYPLRPLGSIMLKNISQPVEAFILHPAEIMRGTR
ncbi:MAG: response regulator [Alphaproteobacteria bacterium]